jgi:hypothetical protein
MRLGALLMLQFFVHAYAQVAVVDAVIRDPIDRTMVRDLLLGRISTWSDGTQVILVLSSDPAGRAAIEALTGRDLDRLLRGWKRLVFSGAGAMPLVASGAQEAVTLVSKRPGAIAIIGIAPPDTARIRVIPLGIPAGRQP